MAADRLVAARDARVRSRARAGWARRSGSRALGRASLRRRAGPARRRQPLRSSPQTMVTPSLHAVLADQRVGARDGEVQGDAAADHRAERAARSAATARAAGTRAWCVGVLMGAGYQSVGARKRALPLAVEVGPVGRLDRDLDVRAALPAASRGTRMRTGTPCTCARADPHGRAGVVDLEAGQAAAADRELVLLAVLVQDLDVVDVLDAAVGPLAVQRVAVAQDVDADHVAVRDASSAKPDRPAASSSVA